MGRKIKYLGTSHNRVLEKGEDFAGRLAEPLPNTVSWTLANNHLVDAEEVGLSDEAVELLLQEEGTMFDSGQYDEDTGEPEEENTLQVMKEFKDVTDAKTVEPSLAQRIYLGLSSRQPAEEATRVSAAGAGGSVRRTAAQSAQLSGGRRSRSSRTGAGSRTGGGGGGTTVGGSTSGTGDGGGGGTTVGGSTGGS